MSCLVVALTAFACAAAVYAQTSGIGVSTQILPSGFFQPKWPYNYTDIVYPFKTALNNPYVCKTDNNVYGAQPEGEYVAVLSLAPCNYITMHSHPEANEFNYLFTGQMTYWLTLGNGTVTTGNVSKQSLMMMPQGLLHVILNTDCGITTFFHFFPVNNPIFSFTLPALELQPYSFLNSSFVSPLPQDIIPDGIHTVDIQCMKRCGLSFDIFNATTGKYKDGLCNHLDPLFLAN